MSGDTAGRPLATLPIGRASREKTPFCLLDGPKDYAERTIGMLFTDALRGPAVVLVCSGEVLFVGTHSLVQQGIESYTATLAGLVEKHSPRAVVQIVPMAMDGGKLPVLSLRAETLEVTPAADGLPALTEWKHYGIVVKGWAGTPEGGVHVDAEKEDAYKVPVPWFLEPKVTLAQSVAGA